MDIDNVLPGEEKNSLTLRTLYESRGYRMSMFEEYGLYAAHKCFLRSERAITFTDLDGRLLALKPDVTLSIVSHYQLAADQVHRLYYNESVYRPDMESGSFREINQTGLECLGALSAGEYREVAALAAQSLAACWPSAIWVFWSA